MSIKMPWAKPVFYGKEKKYLQDALASTWISGGKYIEKFENDFAKYNGSKYGITVSNGTTALEVAILALGIGPGDEVIIPGFTFVAPANMVIKSGAKPVYADIDPETWCIDISSVKEKITDKTKAIIPVHIYGNVCDMDALSALAKEHGLFVIEDTAEAAFSKYNGRYAGTFGDIGCFSFQATKTITMGEGGCVLTNDHKLYKQMNLIRNHGMRADKRYWHDVIGHNFRLTNLQAAVGCGQLEEINTIIARKEKVCQLYRKYLCEEKGITMQKFNPEVEPVVWAVALEIDSDVFGVTRDSIIKKLLESGIETRPGFYPICEMPLYNTAVLPVSKKIGERVISLPSFSSLKEKDVKNICMCLKKCRKK